MGGRGHFDWSTMSIPLENRKYMTLDVVDGIKIIEDFESAMARLLLCLTQRTLSMPYGVRRQVASSIYSITRIMFCTMPLTLKVTNLMLTTFMLIQKLG